MSKLDPTKIHHIRFYQTSVPDKRGNIKPGFILVVPIGLTEFVDRVKSLPNVKHVYSWATHLRYISVANEDRIPWLKEELEKLRKQFEEVLPDITISEMEPPESLVFTPEFFGIKDKNYTGPVTTEDSNFEFYFQDGQWCGFNKTIPGPAEIPVHPAYLGFPGGIILNYSSTKAYKTCPWQYFANSVAKIPTYPNAATHIGWSVHAAAEMLHRKLLGKPGANTMFAPPINLDDAIQEYFKHFDSLEPNDLKPPVNDAEWQMLRYRGENMIRNYFDFLLHDEYEDLKQYILVEKRMKFQLERKLLGYQDNPNNPILYQGVPIWLAGTADLTYEVEPPPEAKLPKGVIAICLCDLKTSVRGLDRLAHVDLMQHLGQLSLYSMMLERTFEKEYGQKAKVVYVEIRNVTPFDGVRSLRVGAWNIDSLKNSDIKRSIIKLYKEVVDSYLTGEFNRTPGYHCLDCDANVPCFLSSGLDLQNFNVIHSEPINVREDSSLNKMQRPGSKRS